jgi:hypothetical protein
MNVYEMDGMALRFIRRPVEDAFRREYAPLFLAAYNEIYRLICIRFYRAVEREAVQLDGEGLVDIRMLKKTMVRLLQVYTGGDIAVSDVKRYDAHRVQVPGFAGQQVQFLYQYMPPMLLNPLPASVIEREDEDDTNVPVFPAAYHLALPLYAAYTWMHAEEKFPEANFYYERAMAVARELSAIPGFDATDAGKTPLRVDWLM